MMEKICVGCGEEFLCSGKCRSAKINKCFCPTCFRKNILYHGEETSRFSGIKFKDCLVPDEKAGRVFGTNFAFKLKPFEHKTVGENLSIPSSMVLREVHALKMDGCSIGVVGDDRLFTEFKVPLGGDDYRVGIGGFEAVQRLELRVQNNYPTPREGEIRVIGFYGKETRQKPEVTRVEGTPKISLKEIEGLEKELLGDA